MTDRCLGLSVILASDLRVDDAEPLMAAIRLLHGVCAVAPVAVNSDTMLERMRTKQELAERLLALANELRS